MFNVCFKFHRLILVFAVSSFLWAETSITNAESVSHGNKSSLMIRYKGAEKIQFFAIQSAPNVLTLDFPGVVSMFDFTKVQLTQVDRIEQLPLDPDSFKGIGLHFYLKPGVIYDVYEGEAGTLIVYLESQDESAAVETAQVEPVHVEDEPAQQSSVTNETLSTGSLIEIDGVRKSQQLYGISGWVSEQGAQLELLIDGEFSHKSFYLDQPDRFAIDITGVNFGLNRRSISLAQTGPTGIRVNQFQVHPEPITRLVFDLTEKLPFDLEPTEMGLIIRWGIAPQALSEPMTVQNSEPVQNRTDLPVASDSVSAPEPEPVMEQSLATDQPVAESSALEVTVVTEEPELVAMAPQPEVQKATEAPVAKVEVKEVKPSIMDSALQSADPIENELNKFLQQEKSLYTEMKSTKPTRRAPKPIQITNAAISAPAPLAETRSMQEDMFKGSLFDQVSSEESYETIDGGQRKYRGIEIQKIDVKDANVVDLLRFLADQVGFNLYVDPSVKNLKATYSFKNIPWDQAMDIILRNAGLAWEFENDVLRVATTKKFKDEELERRELQLQKELSVPPETVTFPLNYSKAEEVLPLVRSYLSPRGTILSDERTNTLIIEDIPKRMQAIRTLIKRLDSKIPQVSIEGRVVETTLRYVKEIGVQWGVSGDYRPEIGTETGVTFPNRVGIGGPTIGGSSPGGLIGGYAVNFPTIAENPSGIGLSLGNFLDNFKLDLSLQLLEQNGLGKIISSPKITTQNNRLANLVNVQRIPYLSQDRGRISIVWVRVGLELEVTPHVTNDKNVILDIAIEKSDPDYTRLINGNPIYTQRRAETRVMVKDGGTTVIGGIFVSSEQENKSGIPKLNRIPLIKYLFGNERKLVENQELLIFLTPRVVRE